MSTIHGNLPPVLPLTRFDIPTEEPTYSVCDNIASCLLGRVDLNLRNLALLAGIVSAVAGTVLTYLSGSLFFAAHFGICAVVSIYSFFEMKDVELARELNGALGQVKTQYLTLQANTQAVAVEAAHLETTNSELSTRNTEFQSRISELEETRAGLEETKDHLETKLQSLQETRDQLQTKLVSLQETRDQLQTNVDHLQNHLRIVDEGDKIYQENMRKIAETTEQQQTARNELIQIQAQLNIVQNLLSKEVSKFQEQNDRLASITTTQTQLFSPARGNGSADHGSGSPTRLNGSTGQGSGSTDHL